MMKKLLCFLAILASTALSYAQCGSTPIPKTAWSIHSFDTQETVGEGPNNGKAIHAIDGNVATFWHTKWKDFTPTYPHEIAVNLGQSYPVNGVTIKSRNDNNTAKPKAYELFLSTDGTVWTSAQSAGNFEYPDTNANGQDATVSFGAINAQYIKLVFTSNYNNSASIAISEISATQISGAGADCVATGQINQLMTFEAISKKYTTDASFNLSASTNSSLPITYTIVSGPATISGSTVSLTGVAGNVIVKATQAGNATYYSKEITRSFQVVDLTAIAPTVYSRLTAATNIHMPTLKPYLLYANGEIDEAQALTVDNIEFLVDGVLIPSHFSQGSFKAWWTPATYGSHSVEMRATASNGVLNSKTVNVTVDNVMATTTVQTFNNDVIDFGTIGSQWFYGTYVLPQSVSTYNQIIANFAVTCPNVPGGCDDWDRLAWVQIKNPEGQWVELFRYITPYGVACSHSIDVTDYESLLQGEVEIRMFIETWGSGGWKLDLNLEYTQGTPTYAYTSVEEVWQGNFNFGDMSNLQPVPQKSISIPSNTESASFRLVTTGHGWGGNNTGNAAEFYNATHKLKVDGNDTFTQHLWTTCNPNPDSCTGQQGTWQYNRAGWCPGTIPAPYFYDITPFINNHTFTFDYQFKTTYKDLCNPSNPACISGTTCADCNDGYNPFYRVGGYMIYKGNSPVETLGQYIPTAETTGIAVYPNTNNGVFNIKLDSSMEQFVVNIFNVSGQSIKTYHFKDADHLNAYQFNLSNVAKGTYFVKVYNQTTSTTAKVLIK
ncbi:discoidin domain-containing protein [Flavobacterium ardleyense]|uniref:discoidin domain-containing protein n=1 Tax=Flavobacterium ardleyense TaxID=2038737 RepID=UPI00298CA8E3|nr:discoidin domain-containing protein [Flavobacterium ardleyense]